jgi:hypothetical protein
MAKVPANIRIAVVDENDVITEIVKFDYSRDLVRDCKKMVDLGAHDEVQVGWKHVKGVLIPPDAAKGGA